MIEIEIETKPNVDSSVMVVYDPVESKGKAGKVAGILVGSFVAVMLVFALIFNLKMRKQKGKIADLDLDDKPMDTEAAIQLQDQTG